MLGSTFIAESKSSKLKKIITPDDLDDFLHITLDRATTIDFVDKLGANIEWVDGPPVQLNEEMGFVIFKVSETALKHVLRSIDKFPADFQTDLKKLTDFVGLHNPAAIYEYACF